MLETEHGQNFTGCHKKQQHTNKPKNNNSNCN